MREEISLLASRQKRRDTSFIALHINATWQLQDVNGNAVPGPTISQRQIQDMLIQTAADKALDISEVILELVRLQHEDPLLEWITLSSDYTVTRNLGQNRDINSDEDDDEEVRGFVFFTACQYSAAFSRTVLSDRDKPSSDSLG
jgi:hypothetical protein